MFSTERKEAMKGKELQNEPAQRRQSKGCWASSRALLAYGLGGGRGQPDPNAPARHEGLLGELRRQRTVCVGWGCVASVFGLEKKRERKWRRSRNRNPCSLREPTQPARNLSLCLLFRSYLG